MRIRIAAALLVFALLFAMPASILLWMTSVPGRSHEGALPPPTEAEKQMAARLEAHVRAVASEPHNLQYPEALERSALYIESALNGIGYDVHRQVFTANGRKVRNIEAVVEPRHPGGRTLIVGAHYDSWLEAPGANDNGTGTAAVIELARLLADLSGKSNLRIRLVLFVNEEPPFFKTEQMGSLVYARRLKAAGEPVLGMLSLETLGFYSDVENSQHYPPPLGMLYPTKGDFVAFVGLTSSRSFLRRAVGDFRDVAAFPSVGGTAPGFVQGIDWSDHWAFEEQGMPALMVTDTAPFRYPHYHSPSDTPDKVDYERLARIVSGLEKMIRRWAVSEGH
ncbi:MAG TPA: M28 family peptidase [Allosphingosinicella sp.]|nr:M28 family peptidase [Allosphingosinicella sp.]